VGSGNVVHNLRGMNWKLPDAGFDWAKRFDEDAKAVMTGNPTSVTELDRHADFGNAVPTPDHFIPLLYLAGLADTAKSGTDMLVDGYTYGSLSMTAYTLGFDVEVAPPIGSGAAAAPADVPPDASNI
jgi:4,5-DOPA dioxygenase extradiol